MNDSGEILRRVRAGLPLDHIPVIDFHTHLGHSSEHYYIPRSRPEQVVTAMDRYGIDRIIAFPICVTSDVNTGNRLQYDAAEAHPDRIVPLALLHAAFPEDWAPILEEGHSRGCRGIKLLSQIQGAGDERTIDWSPAFDYARDKNWAVLHHGWGGSDRLTMWAEKYPEIVFIVGHGSLDYKHVVERFANVYQCTCASFVIGPFASTQAMIDNLPIEKILYGSDALDLDFGTAVGPIAFADASDEVKAAILGGNALRVMKQLNWG